MGVRQRRRFFQDGRTLGIGLLLSGLEAAPGRRQRIVEMGIAQVLPALAQLAVVGVDAWTGHEDVSCDG